MDNTQNSGASFSGPINFKLSNDTAAIVLAFFFCVVAVWAFITIVEITKYKLNKNKKMQMQWVDVGVSSTTAMLAAATGFSAAFLNWPQAQQNSALGVFVIGQTVAIKCMQVTNIKGLIPVTFDTTAVIASILTVITTSNRYNWIDLHNPIIYCYTSAALVGISMVVCFICRLGKIQNNKQKVPIVLCMFASSIIIFCIAVKAILDMVTPYVITMSLGSCASVMLTVVSVMLIFIDI